jgi:fumarylacetoacetate (FAA) hydrolase
MRFVSFLDSNSKSIDPQLNPGAATPGIHTGPLGQGKIINLRSALDRPALTMIQVIEEWATLETKIKVIQAQAKETLEESSVRLVSPIPRPTSMRDGYAFRQHVEAARRNRGVPMIPEFDLFPIFYYTNHLAVTGPGPISVRENTLNQLDFELEAAVVIGKSVRNVDASKLDDAIFGYMIMNDWSARAMQMEEMKLNLGPAKGKDFATSLGPYLVTRDELASKRTASPQGERFDLKMRCFVNEKQVSFGNMKDMNWTFAQILERACYGVTLHPGDVIGSGTVGTGCFLELNGSKITNDQWLKVGDRVVLEIDGLGRLENTITAEKA